jgi:membrane-associated protein
MMVSVVAAAIVGDSVGYEVGRHFGPRLVASRMLRSRRERLDRARQFLARRGGAAVFLGRFVAFFRAVMLALAGTAEMRYPRFLVYNAAGGIVWAPAWCCSATSPVTLTPPLSGPWDEVPPSPQPPSSS